MDICRAEAVGHTLVNDPTGYIGDNAPFHQHKVHSVKYFEAFRRIFALCGRMIPTDQRVALFFGQMLSLNVWIDVVRKVKGKGQINFVRIELVKQLVVNETYPQATA